jgi:hypothetical protein
MRLQTEVAREGAALSSDFPEVCPLPQMRGYVVVAEARISSDDGWDISFPIPGDMGWLVAHGKHRVGVVTPHPFGACGPWRFWTQS